MRTSKFNKMVLKPAFCLVYPGKLMLRKMGKPDTLRVLYPTVRYVRAVEPSVIQMDSLGICFRSYVW